MKHQVYLFLVVIMIASLVLGWAFLFEQKKIGQPVFIMKVPPHSVYENAVFNSRPYKDYVSNIDSAIASLLEYWDVVNFETGLGSFMSQQSGPINLFTVAEFLGKFDSFGTQIKILQFREISNYISAEKFTPLLAQIPISYKGATVPSFAVIVGIDERKEFLYIHNYWLGDSHKISLKELMDAGFFDRKGRGVFLVFEPFLEKQLPRLEFSFDESGSELRKSESKEIFVPYAVALGLLLTDPTPGRSVSFMQDSVGNHSFQKLHPYFQIRILSKLAELLISQGNFDEARFYLEQAISLNHSLNNSHGSWPGLLTGPASVALPYIVLGDLHLATSNNGEAKEFFEKALSINPQDRRALEGLRKARQ